MDDPNPYESPQPPELLTTKQVVKRGFGVGAILFLMPLAILIAFGASCAATDVVFRLVYPNHPALIWLCYIAFFGPPAIVTIVMAYWAIRTAAKRRNH